MIRIHKSIIQVKLNYMEIWRKEGLSFTRDLLEAFMAEEVFEPGDK